MRYFARMTEEPAPEPSEDDRPESPLRWLWEYLLAVPSRIVPERQDEIQKLMSNIQVLARDEFGRDLFASNIPSRTISAGSVEPLQSED